MIGNGMLTMSSFGQAGGVCCQGGVLVAVVRGCNSPLLLKTVTEQLAYEHKVLDGTAERKEVRPSSFT